MNPYTTEEVSKALEIVQSTIHKCEKIQPKFKEGTSQYSLLKNRIKAMYISKALLTNEETLNQYSEEDLINALKPITSIISKCESGQKKHEPSTGQYKRFQKIIESMTLSLTLLTDEISKRD